MNLPLSSVEFMEDHVRSVAIRWGLEKRPLWDVFDQLQPGLAVKWIDRLSPLESIASEWAVAQVFEKALDIEVPPRALSLRMIHLEVQRLVWSFNYMFRVFEALGDQVRSEQTLYLRELALNTLEMLTGGRVLPQFLCLGGVDRDLTSGESRKLRESALHIEAEIRYSFKDLDQDQLIMQGLENVLPLRPSLVRRLNWGGVFGQAADFPTDTRLLKRYGNYDDVSIQYFKNPSGTIEGRIGSDALTRFRSVTFQAQQSLKLIPQMLLSLKEGAVRADEVDVASTLRIRNEDLGSDIYLGVCEAGSGPIYATLAGGTTRLSTASMRLAPHMENLLRGVHRDDLYVAAASLGFDYAQGELGLAIPAE